MDVFICLCGTEAGYPHHPCCPRPMFRADDVAEALWQKDFDANVAAMNKAEGEHMEHLIDAGHQHRQVA